MIAFAKDYLRDRIYACWIGKNIGGTLGTPYEGTHDLLDLRYNTHPIQIGKRRVLLLDILLSHNKNLSVVFHSMLDGTGRFFPGNIQIEDRLREHHHSAERQNRQANRQHISFGIRHKTHLHIFVESHAKAHSSA